MRLLVQFGMLKMGEAGGQAMKPSSSHYYQSINQPINQFISRHSTEARAYSAVCRIKEKCLRTVLKWSRAGHAYNNNMYSELIV